MNVQPHVRPFVVKGILAAFLLAALGLAVQVHAAPLPQNAAQGKALYDQRCASCHSIGGGKLVGPDLKDVTQRRDREWLVQFILDPPAMRAKNDPTAAALTKEFGGTMPKLGLAENEVRAVVAYLAESSGGSAATPAASGQAPAQTQPQPPAGQGDAAAGRSTFIGTHRLQNGGPPCLSCHTVTGGAPLGGGTLGPDLTGAAQRYAGAALPSVLASLPFPTMMPVYQGAPLTPQEQADLAAYLGMSAALQPVSDSATVGLLTVLAFVVLLALIALIWRKRLSGVRVPLVAASERKGRNRP